MTWLIEHAANIFAVIGALYTAALLIVKLTPTPRDDEALEKVGVVLKGIARLFGLDLKQGVEKKPTSRGLLPLLLVAALGLGLSACCSCPPEAKATAHALARDLPVLRDHTTAKDPARAEEVDALWELVVGNAQRLERELDK